MAHYRFNRPLEGSPEGVVRKLTQAEAEPLLKSGAVTETDDPLTDAPAEAEQAEDADDKTITAASVGQTKEAVAAPKTARGARAAN